MTSAIDEVVLPRSKPLSGRLIAAAAFIVPPIALLIVAMGLALRGGGVAAEQWQPASVGVVASLLVLAAVGAIPSVPRAAWPALGSFAALIAWSAASLLWSASREATAENVLRLITFAAATAFGAGYAARPRAALSLAASLALFGGLAAGLIELKLLSGSTSAFFGSRLSWPINYANADAALVWLPVPPLLAFAAAYPLRPLVRGMFGLLAALALAVGLAAGSRGAAIALVVALIASVAIARDRGRFALTLLAVIGPVAFVAARMMAGDPSSSSSAARERGGAALAASAVAAILVCGLAMLDRRNRFPFRERDRRVALALWAMVLVIGVGAFAAKAGRPDTWLEARWNEFSNVHPTLTGDVSHFGTGFSNRYEYWRVAWRTFEAHPVDGIGSGAFSVPWFRSRSIDENVIDAHSWQASALAETGIVGLALTALVFLLPLAAIRNARDGRDAWPIASVALGGTAVYFVVHASLDWLLRIPAVAVPGFVALGALATGGRAAGDLAFTGRVGRAALASAAIVVLVLAIPVYLSTVAVDRAESKAATSTKDALAELDAATELNPFATEPLLVRATILQLDRRPRAALRAATEATERGPQNWTAWLALAGARQSDGDSAGARAALDHAAALNPRAPQLRRLQRSSARTGARDRW